VDEQSRDMGRMEARLDGLDMRLEAADEWRIRIETKLDLALAQLEVARGGLRMLIGIAGVFTGIGALLAQIPHWIHALRP